MSDRYTIEFKEGGVGIIETLATGGIAIAVEKAVDSFTGDDNHGWHCTITDNITGVKASQWGSTKAEAQEKTFQDIKQRIEDFEEEKRHEMEEAEKQKRSQFQKENEAAEYQRLAMQKSQQSAASASSDENDDGNCLGKLIGIGLVAAAVIWFVFSVAIPLILINVAAIALITGILKPEWHKYLFSLSILGAVLIVLDYNNGWSTQSLVNNVSFFSDFITFFLYTNVISGLVAAYFLLRNFLNERNPLVDNKGEFSKRNLIIMAGLTLVGGLTFGLQKYYDAPQNITTNSSIINNGESSIPQNSVISKSYTGNVKNRISIGIVKTKSGSNLRLRARPSDDAQIIANIPNGSSLNIIEYSNSNNEIKGEKDGWCKINFNGTVGWAWGGFIIDPEKTPLTSPKTREIPNESKTTEAVGQNSNNNLQPNQNSSTESTKSVEVSKPEIKQTKLIKCDLCNGQGQIQSNSPCPDCNGIGVFTCTQCNGLRHYPCPECHGNKVFICNNCQGNKTFVCDNCKGQKTLTCTGCRGSGVQSGSNGNHACYTCGGNGKISCTRCGKTGSIPCTRCGKTGSIPCTRCGKTGSLNCSKCNQSGSIRCSKCRGSGQVISMVTCTMCAGKGQINN